tara:strand:+ start:136 stop:294 length:159 start_codon:yes stop_codon:yes gene_type:complete
MDTIAQIFGITFVGIILLCLIWTILSYIFSDDAMDRNKKLVDNMKEFDKNNK